MSVNLTAETSWTFFTTTLTTAFDLFVPFWEQDPSTKKCASYKHYPAKIRKIMNRNLASWHTLRSQPSNVQLKCNCRQIQPESKQALKGYELDR